jgi:hypothetical protein
VLPLDLAADAADAENSVARHGSAHDEQRGAYHVVQARDRLRTEYGR